jgi:dihydroxyacetone kinase
MDRVTGDDDLGISMRRAAEVVRVAAGSYPLDNVAATLKALGRTLQREMGGSSGPLYGMLFLRCGNVLENSERTGLDQWAAALDQGCRAIYSSLPALRVPPCHIGCSRRVSCTSSISSRYAGQAMNRVVLG